MKGKKARIKDNPEGVCDLDKGFIIEGSPSYGEKFILLAKSSRYFQLLIGLTVIGFFLRFYNITFNSIWLDEAATYNFAHNSLADIWSITAEGEYNPPLFHWIEHFMLYFGNNELTLRFIPALLGSLTIPLFYILGKEFFDRNAGIIAAAVLAFSQFHILYSQDARAYTTVLFFFSIALIFYMQALKTNDIRAWALSGIFSGLAFWTHFYVFIIIAGMYLFAIAVVLKNNPEKFSRLKNIGLSIVVFLVVTLPLLIVTINLFIIRTGAPPTYGIQGPGIITESIRQMLGMNILPEIVLVILFIIGLFQAFRTEKMKFSLISAMILLTFIASYFLSFAMPMIPRYLIFILPLFFVTIGYSYMPLWTLAKDRRVVYGLVILMVLISIPGLSGYYTHYTKEDWRGMAGALQGATADGDIVVVLPSYIGMPLTYYYSNQTDHTRLYPANTIAELENINRMKGNNSIFYIMTPDITAVNPSGEVVSWMQANTQYAGERAGIYIFFLK